MSGGPRNFSRGKWDCEMSAYPSDAVKKFTFTWNTRKNSRGWRDCESDHFHNFPPLDETFVQIADVSE